MKRFLAFCMVVLITLGCCACNNGSEKKQTDANNSKEIKIPSTDDKTSVQEETVEDDYEIDSGSNTNTGDYSEPTVRRAVTKSRIPDGVKQFDGDYDNYFKVYPEVEHPGVVGFDATYEMLIYDYAEQRVKTDDIILKANNPKVTVIGTTVIIPYEIRKGYGRVIVTVEDKKDSKKKGTYQFDFLQFTDTTTFADDFAEDYGNWVADVEGGDYGLGLPVIKDGCMEMTIAGREMTDGIRSCVNYKQAYGCFSANMKMPGNSNVIGSFWLFTSSGYIPNPEAPSSTVGEIDIVEFATGSSTAMFTIHWFDYGANHKENNTSTTFAFDPSKFYTFSVVWAPGKIYWYIDGKLYKMASGVDEGAGNGRGGMYPILQAGYYTDYRGFNPVDTLPATVYVDWVEIYGLVID